MKLSAEQERALDLGRPVFLSAGAGSGKTRVLIERYLAALADVGFDVDRVLAVTFTRKAAAEVLGRVREGVARRIAEGGADAARWRRVRECLPNAWITTIDAFCNRVLSTMGPAAGLPARRSILAGGGLTAIVDEAVRLVVDHIAGDRDDPDREALRALLHALGRSGLVDELERLVERRARAIPWARSVLDGGAPDPAKLVEILAAFDPGSSKSRVTPDPAEPVLQAGLARVFERFFAKYRELLAAARACDFRHLLEDVAKAFEDDRIRRAWAGRFRHVLVDEFQDTDPLQWEVLRKLFGRERLERPGLFVVGDEKQAIFSFRDGDVVTFREAAGEITGAGGSEETLADNYRSTPELVAFFNAVSQWLFGSSSLGFEARHSPMRPARAADHLVPSCIEVLVARGETAAEARDAELEAVAARIRRFVDEGTPVWGALDEGGSGIRPAKLADQAILLRARTVLPDLEAVLTAHGIPFRVLGGVGFFACHEVRALLNLMRCLADESDDLALLGVLRSPLFAIADSVLLAAVARSRSRARSLWTKVADLAAAVGAGGAALPTPADAGPLSDAVDRLRRYRALADRLPANELLALAVRESDLMFTLEVVDPSGRSAANVDKLLDMVRRLQAEGVSTLEAIEETLALTDRESESAEAQADPPASRRDCVTILTVHAAKGLEWPIVLLPFASSGVLKSRNRDVAVPLKLRVDGRPLVLHSPRARDARSKTRLQSGIAKLADREALAEARRLLYVAVTRARDHVVLTGRIPAKKDIEDDSWLAWLRAAPDAGARWIDPAPSGERGASRQHPLLETGGDPVAGRPRNPDRERLEEAAPAVAAPAAFSIPATALGTLSSCARKFFLEHVVGVTVSRGKPVGAAVGDAAAGPDPLTRGAIVHAALEGIGSGVDPVARVAGAAARFGLTGSDAVRALEQEVGGAIQKLRAWPVGAEILAARPGAVSCEVPFELGTAACRVVGSIDLLYRPDSGRSVIVDFKTDSDVPVSAAAARRHAGERGYAAQLGAYAAAAHSRHGGDVEAWLFFTQSGLAVPVVGKGVGLPRGRECLESVQSTLGSAPSIADSGFPLTRDPAVCRGCPHLASQLCPGAENGAS